MGILPGWASFKNRPVLKITSSLNVNEKRIKCKDIRRNFHVFCTVDLTGIRFQAKFPESRGIEDRNSVFRVFWNPLGLSGGKIATFFPVF
jgi:hypothetical protein